MLSDTQSSYSEKIAVTIEKPEKTSPISLVFGRCSYFLIYDQEKNEEEILPNPFASELGGAGIQSARFLIEHNVDVVIIKQIGVNPFRFLTSANIKVYKCKVESATEAIKLFTEGKLILLKNIKEDFTFGRKRKRYGRKI
jgi:predicted Fe-Mo cluster-binding NifX family protein